MGKTIGNALETIKDSVDIDIPTLLNSTATILGDRKLARYLSWTALGYGALSSIYTAWKDRMDDRDVFQIVITESDPLYDIVRKVLSESLPPESQNVLEVTSSFSNINLETTESKEVHGHAHSSDFRYISAKYSSSNSREVTLNGVECVIITPDRAEHPSKKDNSTSGNRSDGGYGEREMYIRTDNVEDRDRVLSYLDKLLTGVRAPEPQCYRANSWGSFRHVMEVPKRSCNSVILKEGQMERIMKHFKSFMTNENLYIDLGIPYHTGAMFYGAPGTGKTSLVKAIATELRLNLYTVQLGALENDSALLDLLSELRPNSVLLLEDIDTCHAATDRDEEDSGATLSGLLNALDGVNTPNGLITIMTTNYPEKLDSALVRPGRVDLSEHISEMDDYQVQKFLERFSHSDLNDISLPSVDGLGIVGADLLKIVRDNLESTDKIYSQVCSFIVERMSQNV